MKRIIILALLTIAFQSAFATVYHVSTSGNDAGGDGSPASPWRTLAFAVTKVSANQGHIIKLSAGTFVEKGQFNVPPGVSVEGSGIDQTIIKGASSFHFYPGDPGFATEKFLMALSSPSATNGNQSLKNFSIDGDSKKLHGGIYVRFRNNVLIENVKVQYTNFCGIWLWDVKYSAIKQVKLLNCTWASTGWAAGALQLANLEGVEIDHADIDENIGYGVKALGSGGNKIVNMKFHDSRVSVVPAGKWNNGSAPNISIELWSVELVNCELFNTYMDNHLSLVANLNPPAPQTIRVYNNVIDLMSRAGGSGYGIELSMSNAEIDHNWFRGGSYGIAHWSSDYMSNWRIHHNTFYGLNSHYPGDIIRAQKSGIHNVKLYNNTVEFTGSNTVNFIGLHGGPSDNVEVKNNLIINSSTGYSWGMPHALVFMENGATLSGLTVSNNVLDKLPLGNVQGTYSNNKLVNAQVTKTGERPTPYYIPAAGSPLVDAGANVGFAFQGSAPDIGTYESGGTVKQIAVTGVTVSPATVSLASGQTHTLSKTISPANATNQSVTWTSSNTSVASVSANGVVTAGSTAGSAIVTVKTTDGNKTATASINVTVPTVAVTAVTVAPATIILPVNGTSQLNKTFNPANATNQNVTWTSNNTNVATVTTSGLVTAKALGTAIVTCTSADGNKTSASSISVSANVQFVDVDNASQGTGTNQFNFTGTWSHAISSSDPYLNNTLSFSNTTNNSVTVSFTGDKVELYSAKASHHGIVAVSIDNGPETNVDLYASTRQNFAMVHGSSALTQGTHTIKMRVTGNRNSLATGAYVIVDYLKIYSGSATAVSSINVSPATVSLNIDGTTQLSKTILPSTAINQNVTWKSSNTSIAVVNATGLVTGISVGKVTITATTADGGKTATSSVTVSTPSNAVEFDNASRGTSQNQFNFEGSGWSHAANTADPYFNNTVSFSNVSGNIVTIPFTGNKIEFFSSKAMHHGIVAVSIDNGAEVNIDLHGASRQNYVMAFSSGNLAEGPHTLKIRVTGSKNATSTGTYAVVDYVKVYSGAVGGGSGGMAPAVAVFEEETKSPMEYYPNPILSGDMLHVILPEAAGQVTLMDIAGIPQRTFNVTGSELEIPTSGLFKGMYLLEYKTMKGREVVKIMVQ